MSQLVIKPRMWGHWEPVSATAWRAPHRIHELAATAIAVIGRTRSRLREPGEQVARMEPGYSESARMSREMYRL